MPRQAKFLEEFFNAANNFYFVDHFDDGDCRLHVQSDANAVAANRDDCYPYGNASSPGGEFCGASTNVSGNTLAGKRSEG